MAADVQATQGASASATMIFTVLNWSNLVPRTLRVKLNLNQNINIFIQRKTFENIFCNMAAIFVHAPMC